MAKGGHYTPGLFEQLSKSFGPAGRGPKRGKEPKIDDQTRPDSNSGNRRSGYTNNQPINNK